LRVRKGATAMRWERGNAPIVHATHGNSSCKRELLGAPACLCVGCLPPPPRRVLRLWGSTGARQPVYAPQSWHQRPQTLMNNPTHRLLKKKFAQEQRRQRKFARRGLGRYLRACGLSNRAGCPHRASGWTLARAHAAAAPALQKPLTKRRKRFRGLRARPLTARRCLRPFCAFPSHASQFAVCLRALCGQRDPTGLLRDKAKYKKHFPISLHEQMPQAVNVDPL
jgi:hypothetical protein